MAKFSSPSGSICLNVYFEPSGEPNIVANTSNVTWRITVNRIGLYDSYSLDGVSTLSLDLNGSRVHSSNPRWHTYGEEFQMANGSTTVGHDPDGTKTLPFSATFIPNTGSHRFITLSGNISLPTIPQATTPTLSNSNPVMGTTITINLPRADNSFTHSIFHDFYDGKWTQITTGAGTSHPWTVPLDSFAPRIPNATSGDGRIQVDTWSGDTLIGSKIVNFTASVPTSVVPTIDTKTIEETVAELNTQFGTYVQNKSKIKATMTASGAYSSTIKSYNITANGETFNAESGTTSELKTSGTNRINFEVTDSRGRQATSYIDISVTDYENPKILSVSAIRANADGTDNDKGTYAKITFNASVAPVGNKNTKAFIVKYKKTSSPTWAEVDVTSETYSMNTHTIVAGFDVDYAYDIQLYVADYFTSITFSPIPLPTGFTLVNCHPNGEAVAFGEVSDGFGFSVNLNAQFKKSVDVVGDIYAGGKQIQQHQLTSNNGTSRTISVDPDTIVENGFYYLLNGPNRPFDTNGYLIVERYYNDNKYIVQTFKNVFNGNQYIRVKVHGVWQPWKEYVTTDHPMLQEKPLKTLTMGFPYGLNATLTRKDNLVTATLNRRSANIDVFEYTQVMENIPLGYRPTAEVHMVIVPNSGATTKTPSILHFDANGIIRITNGTGGQNVYTGTISYVTNDAYPK